MFSTFNVYYANTYNTFMRAETDDQVLKNSTQMNFPYSSDFCNKLSKNLAGK